MKTVYVVGFVASMVGGFEWRYSSADAAAVLADWITTDPDCDYSEVMTVQVPDGSADDITEWLDERPELWEPAERTA